MLKVIFLWHMHQPYYVNPLTMTAMMPWVRLHAVKGYLDMIDLALRYPDLRLNFNFTPVLVLQLEELSERKVKDLWEGWSRKPAVTLTDYEKARILENFFKINWDTLIKPQPRYYELLQLRGQNYDLNSLQESIHHFTADDYRDLQTWYNLAWCGYSAEKRYPELKELKKKGRGFTEEEKNRVLDIHHEIVRTVLGIYRDAQNAGKIEITTTPFFHPILPLVYDTEMAKRCMPGRQLPERFSAPEDALEHLKLAQALHERTFGRPARGLWPAEGSVAPELLPYFRQAGIEYFLTDEEVLFRGLAMDPARKTAADHLELFQGWLCHHGGAAIGAVFRERPLSDFIGFNAARNGARESSDFMAHHLKHLATVTDPNRGMVCLALDGENAWEAFADGGEEFLALMYEKILAAPELQTMLLGDYFDQHPPAVQLNTLHTGSWIGGDFDIWIGDPEENRGWEAIGKTRKFLVETLPTKNLSKEVTAQAWMEILAAEGSDWFWWYGPDFQTDCDFLFDELFRTHLQNVYRLLETEPPQYLDVPIRTRGSFTTFTKPTAYIEPEVDGKDSGFFDWMGSGMFDVRNQGSAMFQADRVGECIYYGFSAEDFFVRFDYRLQAPEHLIVYFHHPGALRLHVKQAGKPGEYKAWAERSGNGVKFEPVEDAEIEVACGSRMEIRFPLKHLGFTGAGEKIGFLVQVLGGGVEKERYPERGLIEFSGPSPQFKLVNWFV